MKEWMHFLCVDNENKVKYNFRKNLRVLFEEFDKDNRFLIMKIVLFSGNLSMDELRELLTKNMK